MSEGIPHDFYVRPGGHNWEYWKQAIKYQILFFNELSKNIGIFVDKNYWSNEVRHNHRWANKETQRIISDDEKAKEVLLDIGYYRFGSYLFPFELTYPSKTNRTHKLKNPTFFEDALDLYYFDSDLRLLLLNDISGFDMNFA